MFQKSRNHLEVQCARRVACGKFHIGDPQILAPPPSDAQNLFTPSSKPYDCSPTTKCSLPHESCLRSEQIAMGRNPIESEHHYCITMYSYTTATVVVVVVVVVVNSSSSSSTIITSISSNSSSSNITSSNSCSSSSSISSSRSSSSTITSSSSSSSSSSISKQLEQ